MDIQEERPDDYHRQRNRVLRPQGNCPETEQIAYFADSYASWQKDAIENMNKFIHQYIPKGTDFSELTVDFIHPVRLKINRRPRERLNFSTAKDEFFRLLL